MLTPAQQNYLAYLQDKWPELFEAYARPLLTADGLGDTAPTSGNFFSNLLSSITGAIPSLSAAYAQVKDAQAQAEIMELQRQTQIAAAQGAGIGAISMSTWLLLGGAALVGVVLLSRK